jgi:hypothetical protein
VGRAVPGEPKTEVATKNTKRTKGGRREGKREGKHRKEKREFGTDGRVGKIGLAGGRVVGENANRWPSLVTAG